MITTFTAFIPCIPPKTTAQQHKRIFKGKSGHLFLGTDSKGKHLESQLCSLLLQSRPPESFPKDKPLSVSLIVYFPYRKSEKKSLVKNQVEIPHTTYPDADNFAKMFLDCMTRCGFWHDDSQIYVLRIAKYWASVPGIRIYMETTDVVPQGQKKVPQFAE